MTKRCVVRWTSSIIAGVTAVGATSIVVLGGAEAPAQAGGVVLTPVGVYRAAGQVFDEGAAEIGAYDRDSQRLFVVNLYGQSIDIIDIRNPSAPFLAHTIDVTPWGSQANSVAVHKGIVAVAIEANVKTDPGQVVFFNAYGAELASAPTGALPDMVTFTPNGRMALVANEAEPNSYGQADSVDPEGSVTIVDLRGSAAGLEVAGVTTAGFSAFSGAALDPSIRIFGPGATVAQDLEPEYIAVSGNSLTAFVTLQENNAISVLDLKSRQFTRLMGLGFKNHGMTGAGMDTSDADGVISIVPRPVYGVYMPDGIAMFEDRGRTYLVTANEGDARDWLGIEPGRNEEARRVGSGAVPLDAIAFPNADTLKTNAELGRLNIIPSLGRPAPGQPYTALYSFGARSFSIWDEEGQQVYDSDDMLEQLAALRYPQHFNASNTNQTFDNRSDDKGPEPEGVTIARLWGRQYAFVVLERIGGVVVVELTDPTAPRVVDYVNVRTFTAAADSAAAGDLGPEGVLVISEGDSPTGQPLLVVTNEISGTTRIFGISRP
jgi:hypothetical protein